MSGGWRIARIAGADIIVRPSLLVMGVILVIVFAPQFESLGAGPNPYLTAVVFVLSLYVSVLLHELAHLAAALWFGMSVSSVELHLLGGETRIEGDSRHPWQELVTSIVGPVTSFVIGLAALWGAQVTSGATYSVLWSVGFINLLIAAFNMLPGLPLDGGRVLRALIWATTGSEAKGVRVAGWIGRAAALALMAIAVSMLFGEDTFAIGRALLLLAVALFLWQGASYALRQGVALARIGALRAEQLMRPETPPNDAVPISVDLKGRDLLVAMAENPSNAYALVDGRGTVVGTLFASSVDRAYREAG
ncbi:M50 family metallopeptidase [Aeromicrobium choanae]|uniref:Zn-dependent protease (Includes SpoIVFB) n=1 Tax=Aeromicrobium choanae TaxID=1736691 RepID=A0A1T4Z8P7_9ACTN|nr:M50 family metallopeptidase [Aeromicrobium choanae]SKB10382.1 Zn-dependent protease (includes SpoIVFB) [Aeromicrobium choanae]